MKLNAKSGASIAMTAAALIIGGATLISAVNAAEIQGRCFGVNGCKGHGACKSAKNDCKGHNACKGQGWLAMTDVNCKAQNGQFEKS
ncbi:MAG: BufA2 family periplasmic bufferin-type metallophore [Methyloceanibacter sp.]|uniref:BufA2 family periplasmic bufferin-type metallophore n=1 Tax=Methyloceanibacter sp. TaxID=1965321 RepID=UPI003D9B0BAE